MLPTVVIVQAEIDLHEGTPLWSLGLVDEPHASLLGSAVGLFGVTDDTRADDVFPRGRTASIARDDVVQVQVFAVGYLSAVLAGVFVSLKNVVAGEFDFLLRQAIEQDEQDHARDANPKGNRGNAFRMGFLL